MQIIKHIKKEKNEISGRRLEHLVPMVILLLFIMFIASCNPADIGENTNPQIVVPSNAQNTAQSVQHNEPTPEAPSLTEEVIDFDTRWSQGPHANSYVEDASGSNNKCARCHAPINWQPSMDDIPESCLTCKFELKTPPSKIAENDWMHIPCKVCHEVSKRGEVDPMVRWLEIAQIGEYIDVGSTTELCQKCHVTDMIPDHYSPEPEGGHVGYQCTECHDAHNTAASCSTSSCHPDILDGTKAIPGHDELHINITCAACHDGAKMNLIIEEGSGYWTTEPYKSHNIILAAPCERCHFPNNPWKLSEQTATSP